MRTTLMQNLALRVVAGMSQISRRNRVCEQHMCAAHIVQ